MTRYRHAKGCNWRTKHPEYRSVWSTGGAYENGTPMVLAYYPHTGTCLQPCDCWTAMHPTHKEATR